MATVQENTGTDNKDRVVNIKIPKGSQLDQRIEYFCGMNAISAAEFLRHAVEAYLVGEGLDEKWTMPEEAPPEEE